MISTHVWSTTNMEFLDCFNNHVDCKVPKPDVSRIKRYSFKQLCRVSKPGVLCQLKQLYEALEFSDS